jgi:hypothetical protein
MERGPSQNFSDLKVMMVMRCPWFKKTMKAQQESASPNMVRCKEEVEGVLRALPFLGIIGYWGVRQVSSFRRSG